MITNFVVGAELKLIDLFSPQVRKIIAEIRELNKARASMAALSKAMAMPSLAAATGETESLALAWKSVSANAAAATRQIGTATAAAARAAVPPGFAGGGGGGGGRAALGNRLGIHGGGGVHFTGPGVGMPGGGHMNFRGNGGGMAMGAAGLLGYAGYEAAEMEKAVWWLNYHSGLENNDANKSTFQKTIQDSMGLTGFNLKDTTEGALDTMRMFKGTPGGGVDVLPEILKSASIESMAKGGTSPKEAVDSLIGLAHMTKEYSPEEIKKLAPAFAFLSTANPARLGSIEKSAGYAVPLMQSGLEIDPTTSLLLGTALTRAGATNTKSGTWLREMALRAMPGTSMMSKMAFKKHEEALKEFGLVDDKGKPTWFDDKGKPDILKMLDIAGARAQTIPLDKRAAYERSLFGAQGGGGFALLADPKVRDQIQNLKKEMDSPEFKNKYSGFFGAYNNEVTAQGARLAMAQFNNTMIDLGMHTLPAANQMLKDFTSALARLRGMIPGASKTDSVIGTRALEGMVGGAAAGFVTGMAGSPVGAVGGAVIGGVGGVAAGYLEQQAREAKEEAHAGRKRLPVDLYNERMEKFRKEGSVAPVVPPIHLNLNIDGRALAAAVSEQQNSQSQYTTDTPASNGTSLYGP